MAGYQTTRSMADVDCYVTTSLLPPAYRGHDALGLKSGVSPKRVELCRSPFCRRMTWSGEGCRSSGTVLARTDLSRPDPWCVIQADCVKTRSPRDRAQHRFVAGRLNG